MTTSNCNVFYRSAINVLTVLPVVYMMRIAILCAVLMRNHYIQMSLL